MDINSLNAFLGYGDFRSADILILSKHEGADNDLIKEELDARINHFGLEKDYWLDKENRLNGYWHPSPQAAGEIKEELIEGEVQDGRKVPFVISYPARILLALEEAHEKNSSRDMDKWFKPLGKSDHDSIIKIRSLFKGIYSYQSDTRLKAVLSHYQPLLRESDSWPYSDFAELEYLNVFGKCEQPENPVMAEIRNHREDILANLLKKYPKKLIICTGNFQAGRHSLRSFFEREFKTNFKYFKIGGNLKGATGVFSFEGQKTVVINTHGFANGGGLDLNEILSITRKAYKLLKDEKVHISSM